jgi:hypothetical protein
VLKSPFIANHKCLGQVGRRSDGNETGESGTMTTGCRWSRSDTLFIAALLLVCSLSIFVGIAVPLGTFAHDTFFLLDNAYRVVQGQVPHRDFSSAWGPVIFLIDATGLLLAGMRPAAFGYANALFGGVLAIWAFLIVRPRWSSASACVAGIYTLLLITAPFSIGLPPLDFGYAMSYNRYGYALCGIVMLGCGVDMAPPPAGARQQVGRSISMGIALGLLAFLKISYAFVAGPFIIILTMAAGAGRMRRIIGLSSGFAIVAAAMLCYLRFDVADMLQDLRIAAASRRLSLYFVHQIGALDLLQIIVILCFAAGLMYRARVADQRAGLVHGALLAILTIMAGYLLLMSNQQVSTFPLNGYAALTLVAGYGPFMGGRPLQLPGFTPGFPMALLMAACVIPFCLANGVSLAAAAVQLQWPVKTDVVPLESTERGVSLRFRVVAGARPTETEGAGYVAALDDGVALLRRRSGNREGVLTFDEFNPFNYLLDRPSPRGGLAAAAYNYIFSATAHPTPERFLGDAPYVMIRKYKQGGPNIIESEDVRALMRIYGAALRSHYTVVEETQHWVLWHHIDATTKSTGVMASH